MHLDKNDEEEGKNLVLPIDQESTTVDVLEGSDESPTVSHLTTAVFPTTPQHTHTSLGPAQLDKNQRNNQVV